MDLLLDIRNADNIESAMSGYFKKEVLGQEDAYKGILIKIGEYNVLDLDPPPFLWKRISKLSGNLQKKGGKKNETEVEEKLMIGMGSKHESY